MWIGADAATEPGEALMIRDGRPEIKLWLDDQRPPWKHGRLGWEWARNYDEAIELLTTHNVVEASLDHDLTIPRTIGIEDGSRTGADVCVWMRDNNVRPPKGVHVHTASNWGRKVMAAILDQAGMPYSVEPA